LVWFGREYLELGPGSSVVTEPEGAIQVLFTAPRYPDEPEGRVGGVDTRLAEAIDTAEVSVDIAAFDFDLESVSDALVRAMERGVQVRLVTDADYAEELGPQSLRQASVPVVTDERSGFMHNKFVVIDSEQVWTGSWNLTDYGTFRNNNNVIVIDSEVVATNYLTEFEEMFLRSEFGPTSEADTPYPNVDLDGVLVENFFASEEDVQSRILEILEEAESSVRFLAFTLTDDDIASMLVRKHREGLDVRGVVESRNVNGRGSDVAALQQAGVEVLPDGNPYVMHHKVIVVDEEVVIAGSYNFSASAAEENDENVVIVYSPQVAAHYLEEFDRVYAQAKEEGP
jgi:phosphatidylserine/phosphatidylglycerophosphate/cardiolipin synthase-like enzyme